MIKRRLIDTNLIVRHLVKDNQAHAQTAAKLFSACDRGNLRLIILPAVLAESVFVLESFYKHPRSDITRVLKTLVSSPGVELDDLAIHLDGLSRYEKNRAHFVDCTIAAFAAAHRTTVATFDADFNKFTDVIVQLD